MYSRSPIVLAKLSNIILGVSCLSLAITTGSQNLAVAAPSGFGMCRCQTVPVKPQQLARTPQQAPKQVYLQHSNGIYILSDRPESFATSFNRRRIIAGKVIAKYLPPVLAAATIEQEQCFVSYPSFNDDRSGKVTTYGLAFKLAPISAETLQLWKTRHQSNVNWTTIFLEPDAQNSKLYHFVGWDENSRFSFFAKESAEDVLNRQSASISGRELLWYQGKY
jgi:hypothetical protein